MNFWNELTNFQQGKLMQNYLSHRLTLLVPFVSAVLFISACVDSNSRVKSAHPQTATTKVNTPYSESIEYAINVGGGDYIGNDGISYQADDLSSESQKGTSKGIKGSQDPYLYESYRIGDMDLPLALENGIYDITLKFAEPANLDSSKRLFDIFIEDTKHLSNLDIMQARDGKPLSALDRTIPNIKVNDGVLNITLKGQQKDPVLHAIIVRRKQQPTTDWKLVWSDEFNYDGAPDENKWNFDIWPARKVNDEDQTYTNRTKNVRVEDGVLIIEAHKEKYANAEYTSGRIHSKGKGDFLYGKAEIRARIPAGQGTWPAIWMLPSDAFKYATKCGPGNDWQGNGECDAWPNSGEIDIMEYVGYDPHNIHGTVHNKAYYWVNWEQRKASIDIGDEVNQEFQTYSIEWGPEHILIAYNNTPYFFYANQGEGWEAWPFDHPYHIILNLAIGGGWGRAGGPIDDSIFPVRLEVDYVRVYELNQ